VMAVLPAWWDGRDLRSLLPRVFFEHFRGTSLIVEHEDVLVGFLVGFLCADHADEAYIHFVGVAPGWRRAGLASDLYRRFFAVARTNGRSVVRSVTAPVNTVSVAFHTALGFSVLPGEGDGSHGLIQAIAGDASPATAGQAHQAGPYVRFQLFLEPDTGAAPEAGA